MRREAAAALTEALCDEDKCVRVLVVLLEGRRLLLARPLRHAEQRPWPPAKLSGHRCSRRVTRPQPGPSPPPSSSCHAASGAPLSLPLLSPKCCVTGAVPPLPTGAPLHVAFSSRRRPCARPRTILHAIAFSPRSRTNLTCCHSEHRAESREQSCQPGYCSHEQCPPSVRQKVSKGINSPAQGRGDCMQDKPTNQTRTYPSQTQQRRQPNKQVLTC